MFATSAASELTGLQGEREVTEVPLKFQWFYKCILI